MIVAYARALRGVTLVTARGASGPPDARYVSFGARPRRWRIWHILHAVCDGYFALTIVRDALSAHVVSDEIHMWSGPA